MTWTLRPAPRRNVVRNNGEHSGPGPADLQSERVEVCVHAEGELHARGSRSSPSADPTDVAFAAFLREGKQAHVSPRRRAVVDRCRARAHVVNGSTRGRKTGPRSSGWPRGSLTSWSRAWPPRPGLVIEQRSLALMDPPDLATRSLRLRQRGARCERRLSGSPPARLERRLKHVGAAAERGDLFQPPAI